MSIRVTIKRGLKQMNARITRALSAPRATAVTSVVAGLALLLAASSMTGPSSAQANAATVRSAHTCTTRKVAVTKIEREKVHGRVVTKRVVVHVNKREKIHGKFVIRSVVKYRKVRSCTTPVTTTTTTVPPTTTTTTTPAGPVTQCTGGCKFTFPSASLSGWVSVALNNVIQGVPCADPGVCDASATQQIDDANVTMCAGPSGVSDASSATANFALALSGGTQAPSDSVTFDSSVPTAFGGYGAVAPSQCVTGDIYFDAPSGSQWSSLNYAYTSADYSTQTVYVWSA